MKLKRLTLLPIMCLLTACGAKDGEKEVYYAYFMNNYPRVVETAPSGFEEKMDNTLYKRVEIQANTPFSKPEDPSRENYQFKGWFREKACENEWDFKTSTLPSTITDDNGEVVYQETKLFARWVKE